MRTLSMGSCWRLPDPARVFVTERSLHPKARVRFREHVPFPSSFFGVRASQHRVGKLLAQLDAGLVQRIYPVQLTRVDRRDLEEHQQLTKMARVHPVDGNREVRPTAPSQRARRRAPLDVEQLAQPMTAEVAQLLDVGVQLRNLHPYVLRADGDEADRLVGRTLHEELNLAVLVGGSQRAKGRRADAGIACRAMLAEALRPALHEPVGEI